MKKNEWTAAQRIELCGHIAPLILSGLPIDRGLKAIVSDLPKRLQKVTHAIQTRLENGESLQDALASGTRPESRSLSATIEAGEISGELGTLLEGWASMHTALAIAKKRFRIKLVYPVFSILVAVLAIGFTIHALVPQYRANLLSLRTAVPNWFGYIEFLHRNIVAWGVAAACLSISPILWFAWRRCSFDPFGWPRDPAYRSRLRAHSASLAAKLIQSNIPIDITKELASRSLGVIPRQAHCLSPASLTVFTLSENGGLDSAKAIAMQQEISRFSLNQAVVQTEAQARWIGYSVSIAVAIFVGLTYVLVVYLPWLYLLDQLKQVQPIR
ncbi:MAG: type II secretion system F family protein [Planctomycetota bacterium]|nr:type II secretion system F family protein [Planctomycetota bacterium]